MPEAAPSLLILLCWMQARDNWLKVIDLEPDLDGDLVVSGHGVADLEALSYTGLSQLRCRSKNEIVAQWRVDS